jgi:hypothetical protein
VTTVGAATTSATTSAPVDAESTAGADTSTTGALTFLARGAFGAADDSVTETETGAADAGVAEDFTALTILAIIHYLKFSFYIDLTQIYIYQFVATSFSLRVFKIKEKNADPIIIQRCKLEMV